MNKKQNEIQDYFNSLSELWRKERSETQLTLWKLISRLVKVQENNLADNIVYFNLCSYRGYYADLALSTIPTETISIEDAIVELQDTIDKEFRGYKGGEFIMDKNTPLWVADYGNLGNKIVDIQIVNNTVYFITKEDE